jgi:hypothetical protein
MLYLEKLNSIMSRLRIAVAAYVAFASAGLAALPAHALPFKNSCASMQAYLNSLKWKVPTRLSGFETADFSQGGNSASCRFGYVEESSPMGTKACERVWIFYNGDDSSVGWRVGSLNSSDHCRFKR